MMNTMQSILKWEEDESVLLGESRVKYPRKDPKGDLNGNDLLVEREGVNTEAKGLQIANAKFSFD
jgi:hypothetical protein